MLDLIETKPAEELDLLFVGGTVIDPETGLHGERNVGIAGDKIAYIGREQPSATVVRHIEGHILAPGFIDLHSHAQSLNGHRLQALDGVTTSLELEAGTLPIAQAYSILETEGRPTNFGFSASWAAAKIQVAVGVPNEDAADPIGGNFGQHVAAPGFHSIVSSEQVDEILALLEQGISEGALGIGVLLGYSVETGRTEFYEVAKLAAKYDGTVAVHVRSGKPTEPLSNTEAVLELVASAAATGAHMHMCHINSTSNIAMDTALAIIERAQAQGLKVTSEFYPYSFASTVVGSIPTAPGVKRLGRPDFTDIFLVSENRYVRDLEDLKEQQAKNPAALYMAPYLDDDDPEEIAKLFHAMSFPGLAVASDAMPLSNKVLGDTTDVAVEWPLPNSAAAHPRTAGCFSRVLRWAVRETGIYSWDEAVRRCSLVPAQIMEDIAPAFKNKGRIQLGKDADLVVFDPKTVTDNATHSTLAPSSGYAWVVVNGVPVVEDSRLVEGVNPGRAIRNKWADQSERAVA